jgi:hypothetical protein
MSARLARMASRTQSVCSEGGADGLVGVALVLGRTGPIHMKPFDFENKNHMSAGSYKCNARQKMSKKG